MNGAAEAPSWSLTWEDDVPDEEHVALAALFAASYPRSRTSFTGARSWSSARPELRIVGRIDGRPVAHAGILRRFLRVTQRDVSQLVGDVGLVAVDPERQGRGVGAQLLTQVSAALWTLGVPFGFLTCGHHVAPFYRSSGWVPVSSSTRMVRADGRVQVYGGASMVLPVHAPMEVWPDGEVDRNGLEV